MTDKLTCGRLSTCELCSRCLLAEMLFKGRTWLPHPSMSWVGGLTTLCDRVQSSREGARARVSPYMTGSGAWLACNTSGTYGGPMGTGQYCRSLLGSSHV